MLLVTLDDPVLQRLEERPLALGSSAHLTIHSHTLWLLVFARIEGNIRKTLGRKRRTP